VAKTPEKPPFSVISALPVEVPDPPRPLGARGRQLWDRVQTEYRIGDIGGIELLAQACAALDRAEGLAAAIAADGDVIRTRTGVPHASGGEGRACVPRLCRAHA
jgi:hypothetical protein